MLESPFYLSLIKNTSVTNVNKLQVRKFNEKRGSKFYRLHQCCF